mmetsp:Transcript_27863/g.73493  ORF Transcript_27863/g.73493 Transcript_27863/m.73493 type:complete len:242 (+) Transcript_27863:1139-1864(+)
MPTTRWLSRRDRRTRSCGLLPAAGTGPRRAAPRPARCSWRFRRTLACHPSRAPRPTPAPTSPPCPVRRERCLLPQPRIGTRRARCRPRCARSWRTSWRSRSSCWGWRCGSWSGATATCRRPRTPPTWRTCGAASRPSTTRSTPPSWPTWTSSSATMPRAAGGRRSGPRSTRTCAPCTAATCPSCRPKMLPLWASPRASPPAAARRWDESRLHRHRWRRDESCSSRGAFRRRGRLLLLQLAG